MATPSGGVDEKIVIEIAVVAEEFLKNSIEVRAAIDDIKEKARETAKATKQDFDTIRLGFKEGIKEEAKRAKEAMKEFGEVTPEVAKKVSEATSEMQGRVTLAFKEIAAESRAAEKQFNLERKVREETEGATDSLKIFGVELQAVGKIASFVFGSVLGITVFSILRKFIGLLGEATEAGLEFGQSLFKLEVAVRALQREGVPITFAEVSKELDKLRLKWRVFTRQELVDGIAQITLLTREFGLSKKETFELTDAVATLSALMGKDFNESAKQIALAISSGYSEALQKAGLNVNRVTIAQRALELGIKASFNQMTGQERAAVTLALILEQVADVSDEAATFQETLAGRVQVSTTRIEDFKNAIGLALLPLQAIISEIKAFTVTVLGRLSLELVRANTLFRSLTFILFGLAAVIEELGKEDVTLLSLNEALRSGAEEAGEFFEKLEQFSEDLDFSVFEDMRKGFDRTKESIEATEDALGELQGAFDRFRDNFIKIQLRFDQQLVDLEIKLQRDLAKIDADGMKERIEIRTEFAEERNKIIAEFEEEANKIIADTLEERADIREKFAQKILELEQKLELDIQQVNRQFALKLESANLKFRENEIQAEENFQEKLRRLREGFLLNLEDAVQERDARQVLRLTRRFALENNQAIREAELAKTQRSREFQLQLTEIEAQRNERLTVLQEEFNLRLAIIQANRANELQANTDAGVAEFEANKTAKEEALAANKKSAEDELAQLTIDLEDEATERNEKFDEQLDDLERNTQNRRDALVEDFRLAEGLTAEGAKAIREALEAELGPSGAIDATFTFLEGRILQFIAIINQLSGIQIPTVRFTGGGTFPKGVFPSVVPDPEPEDEFQTGGSKIFNRPTTIRVGEVPELATFTPINQINTRGGSIGMGEQMARILISLDQSLIGEIIDQSLDNMAVVLESVGSERPF